MNNEIFNFNYNNDAVFFCDCLKKGKPFIAFEPRNHESLFFVTKGTLEYEKGGKSEFVKTGQVGYIKRGSTDKSGAYNCDGVSYIAVNFNFDRESKNPEPTLPFDTVCCKYNTYKMKELFETALNEYRLGRFGSKAICTGALYQTVGMLFNLYATENVGMGKMKKIGKAFEYLKENFFRSDLRIKKLAEISNMSEKHFRRVFFEVYGKNPYEFLTDFRLNEAKTLLLNSSKKISDIAFECGFSDVYSFSHSFKRNYGASPKNYRENLR